MGHTMTAEDILGRLDGVRKSRRGWLARCPAHHPDRNPSLSVSEGDKGILLKCWASCTLAEICVALEITPSQLFYDAHGPIYRANQRQRSWGQAEQVRKRANWKRVDALREAEAVIRAATNVDISAWTNEQLDTALNSVCDAHELLLREEHHATQFEPAST
jgi:hypothetical protein